MFPPIMSPFTGAAPQGGVPGSESPFSGGGIPPELLELLSMAAAQEEGQQGVSDARIQALLGIGSSLLSGVGRPGLQGFEGVGAAMDPYFEAKQRARGLPADYAAKRYALEGQEQGREIATADASLRGEAAERDTEKHAAGMEGYDYEVSRRGAEEEKTAADLAGTEASTASAVSQTGLREAAAPGDRAQTAAYTQYLGEGGRRSGSTDAYRAYVARRALQLGKDRDSDRENEWTAAAMDKRERREFHDVPWGQDIARAKLEYLAQVLPSNASAMKKDIENHLQNAEDIGPSIDLNESLNLFLSKLVQMGINPEEFGITDAPRSME